MKFKYLKFVKGIPVKREIVIDSLLDILKLNNQRNAVDYYLNNEEDKNE